MSNHKEIDLHNICQLKDGYKNTHYLQYPPGTEKIAAYFCSRGGESPFSIFFGIQYYLEEYLAGKVVTQAKIDAADKYVKKHMGFDYFNREGWEYILNELGGKLPIEIRALPEGSKVPTNVPYFTIENTDPECYWLPNYLESLLSKTWYPITVATRSNALYAVISKYTKQAGETVNPFHMNNFGDRGSTSVESAGIGDMAFLTSFAGTDTEEGPLFAKRYYDAELEDDDPAIAGTVMAAEHSTVTSFGKGHELEAYQYILSQTPPEATLSQVCDSYDTINAVDCHIGLSLHDHIMTRPGKYVVRPDSGDPVEISAKVMQSLWRNFGGTINSQGYKVLDPHVGVIYGEGIDTGSVDRILDNLCNKLRFAPSNIIFGSGGALVQKMDRDTLKCGFKASAILRDGTWTPIAKDPIETPWKKSMGGRFCVVEHNNTLVRLPWSEEALANDMLTTVFLNGEITQETNFDEVRMMVKGSTGYGVGSA